VDPEAVIDETTLSVDNVILSAFITLHVWGF
jgi:hypothetical protein